MSEASKEITRLIRSSVDSDSSEPLRNTGCTGAPLEDTALVDPEEIHKNNLKTHRVAGTIIASPFPVSAVRRLLSYKLSELA